MDAKQITGRVLERQFNQPVRLGDAEKLRSSIRSAVYRFPVLDGPTEAPASVIVKQATRPYGTTIGDAIDGSAWQDWAGLQLLVTVSQGNRLAPRCYGGDVTSGLLVIEDLGAGPSLRDVLAGDDGKAAEEALVSFCTTLGRLHAATVGHEATYHAIRTSLGPYHPDCDWFRSRYGQVPRLFDEMASELKITPAAGVTADLATMVKTLRDPGPFLSFIHGDPTASNCLLSQRGTRMIDWEYSTYAFALLDGVQPRMCLPTGPFTNRIPSEVIHRAESAYRLELARGIPAAADETLWGQALVLACAYWTIGFLSWLPFAELMRADQQWGIATVRQRVILFATIFAHTAEQYGYLQSLGATYQAIASKLKAIWPEAASMPLYPAFTRL